MMLEEELPRSEGVQYASVGKCGGQLLILIAPVRMKQQGKAGMMFRCGCQVESKVSSCKENIALEASMLGP